MVALALIEVSATQFLIGYALGQDVVDHDQHAVPNSDQGALLPSAGSDAALVGRQIGSLGLGSDVGNLDQGPSQPGSPFAGPPTQLPTTTLGIAGCRDTSPHEAQCPALLHWPGRGQDKGQDKASW